MVAADMSEQDQAAAAEDALLHLNKEGLAAVRGVPCLARHVAPSMRNRCLSGST